MSIQTRLSCSEANNTRETLDRKDAWDEHIESTLLQLNQIYINRVEPVEGSYDYSVFRPTWFSESIKQKKPFVTFLGPFSSGKSSFINYLLQGDYLLTGPQPVTDKFTVIMYGEELQQIPGRVLMADSRLPYRGLSQFGDAFAEFFSGVVAPHPILRSVSLIDTPGILEAAGDTHARRYNYTEVCRWFVEKSDLVFFLFDPTKLDAGPELRQVFSQALLHQESKIRIVMNKADAVRPQELMRVYGSLYWNLSNLVRSTEPPRLYVSSFWDTPYRSGTDHALFEKEKEDLLYELIVTIPLQSLDRRVTSMMQRANDVLLFALICATYRSRLPTLFGKSKAKERFFEEYDTIVKDLAARYHVSENNFPNMEEVRAFLLKVDSKDFPDVEKLEKRGWIKLLKSAIETDLPRLFQPLKEHSMCDPRERRKAIMLQRSYIKKQAPSVLSADAAAATSLDGSNSASHPVPAAVVSPTTAAAPTVNSVPSPSDTNAQMMVTQMMALQQQQQPVSIPSMDEANAGAVAAASNDQMQRTMQNMMAMVQQQMQQLQPQQQLH
ncbi:hypothetical protein GH5_01941 [Leishmania sp. Ghana 2012 LV757]|uniref:hypothetical protein n=1 Tax=Leishmania sp. Ghana 2012 LV757 TaxID=2803181 RepID=UPI001B6BB1BF|nr:hypothetical protein GH5_01941 [Leishmania sp. Ghana 2012 LV757]